MSKFQNKVADFAKTFEGVREVGNNQSFNRSDVATLMERYASWRKGWAYCACFAKMIWAKSALDLGMDSLYSRINILGSASAVQSWNSFDDAEDFETIDPITRSRIRAPKVGDLVFWRKGRTALGHAGVVIEVSKHYFITIEGNTNAQGSREGNGIFRRKRMLIWGYSPSLYLLGFVRPKSKFYAV